MSDELELARLAIIVSAVVSISVPLIAAVAPAAVARRHESERRLGGHAEWLRDQRAEAYVGVMREAAFSVELDDFVIFGRGVADALEEELDRDRDLRLATARARAFGSLDVRRLLDAFVEAGRQLQRIDDQRPEGVPPGPELEEAFGALAAARDELFRRIIDELQSPPDVKALDHPR